uniref:Uncharacterized protein n=1 Tax=Phlebotomus papatasi TaxID=29031 RepID=A0A1B0D397_PHLPP
MKNASIEDFHLIGHSLGCHLAGYAGSFTKSGQVGRITGLDPAIIGFEWSGPESRLDDSDAVFVDVIHTAAGSLGFRNPLGHADFYPNGGFIQPGCGTNLIDQREHIPINLITFTPYVNFLLYRGCSWSIMACSHGRAHHLFAESILTSLFYSYPCTSWAAFTRGNYNGSDMILMGEGTSHEAKGIFCVQTNSKPPYAMGPFFGPFGFFWDTINLLNG